MRAVVFDLDQTMFKAEDALHEGVKDLFRILERLGVQIAGLTKGDHRVLVRLDEAGVLEHFSAVMCADHVARPKAVASLEQLIAKLDVDPAQTALVSRLYSDVALGKKVGLGKTIGMIHGRSASKSLAQADHLVPDFATVLDVIG
jgi:phosphoglycolate phosphatase-like HAD superfamily hydrolase